MTAQSLKARVAKRLKATGQPKRRRRDRYSKPFRSKPKPEGYVFGRPTLYRPEYCQRAIDYMGQGYSVTALAGHLGMSKDAIYDWINLYPDFCHAVNMGRAARVAALGSQAPQHIARCWRDGSNLCAQERRPRRMARSLLHRDKVNVSIEQMSDEELLAIISKANTPTLIEAKPVEAVEAVTDTMRHKNRHR